MAKHLPANFSPHTSFSNDFLGAGVRHDNHGTLSI